MTAATTVLLLTPAAPAQAELPGRLLPGERSPVSVLRPAPEHMPLLRLSIVTISVCTQRGGARLS